MRLVLLRHGESEWNRDNRFTGWADVDLTERGVAQMREAGALVRAAGIDCDVVFTSVLKRCVRATWIALESMDRMWVPQVLDWRLNERHYGGLTGQSKAEAIALFGETAVHKWRRGYDTAPPAVDAASSAYIPLDGRYAHLARSDISLGESLHQTTLRVFDAWRQALAPSLVSGQSVLVVAHGNSLRALIKIVEGLSNSEISKVEVANGVPIVYEMSSALGMLDKRLLGDVEPSPSEIL